MRHWLRRPWETHPVGLATGLLADGQIDLGGLLASIQMAEQWPTGDLRLVAVRIPIASGWSSMASTRAAL